METFNLEAEQSVLGALLQDNDAFDRIAHIDAAHFFRADHRAIFVAMLEEFKASRRYDIFVIHAKVAGQVQDALRYLNQLMQTMPTSATIERHAEAVYDKAVKRSLAALGLEMEGMSQSHEDAASCVDLAASKLESIALRRSSKEPKQIGATMSAYLDVLTNRMDGMIKPISTGFDHLDEQLDGGFERGTLTVLAGRPGTGKTAAGLGLCRNVAHDGTALFLSMEMSETQVNDRNISAIAQLPMKWLRRPTENMSDNERWKAISHAVKVSQEMRLYIDDQSALTLTDVRAKARKIKRLHGLDLLCIDQLSFLTGARSDKLHEAMGEYTRGLISIAKELDCAIVLLAQLNRDCEKRADHRPIMSDLGVSGYIEQDAANIIFLYRDVLWFPDSQDKEVCEWICAKTRQGAPGTVGIKFIGEQTRFETLHYRWQRTYPAKADKGGKILRGGFD